MAVAKDNLKNQNNRKISLEQENIKNNNSALKKDIKNTK